MIKYLKQSEIDKQRWDECVSNSENRLIYALSWYLDIVSPNWDGLVLDDYKAVMPLTWKQKFGIRYIFKPLFIQQLGIFGREIKEPEINSFINKLPDHFQLADLSFNESNTPDSQKYTLNRNNNYILSLDDSYENISKGYNRNCKRNISKAKSAGLYFSESIKAEEFFKLIISQIKEQIRRFGKKEEHVFRNLVDASTREGKGEIIGIRDTNNNLVAAGFYIFSYSRLIFLICGSTDEGKENQAMYLLVDEQVKRNAGKFLWYDFGGSNIKGIAYFNSTFGSKETHYYSIRINKLSLIKKILSRKYN